MTKVIRYVASNGAVQIVHFRPLRDGETEEQLINAVSKRAVPVGVDFDVVDYSTLPANRRWRDAWQVVDGNVVVDLNKAKKIRTAELERDRVTLLEENAKEYMVANAKGDVVSARAIQKKVQDLSSLDKTAIELSVATVVDLAALDTHEPDPIKDAKQGGKK